MTLRVAPKAIAFALPLLLTACATPSQRITKNLAELGVPPAQAKCMGTKLGQRLSVGQLLRLQELTGITRDKLDRMSIRQIAAKLTDEKDPGLVAEFIRAGVGCVI